MPAATSEVRRQAGPAMRRGVTIGDAGPRQKRFRAIPVIHVIHRRDRVDLPFVRLAKGDTILLQAKDEAKRNLSEVNCLWLIEHGLVPSGNRTCRIGSVDRGDRIRRVIEVE